MMEGRRRIPVTREGNMLEARVYFDYLVVSSRERRGSG
jgi:hypothetical protein